MVSRDTVWGAGARQFASDKRGLADCSRKLAVLDGTSYEPNGRSPAQPGNAPVPSHSSHRVDGR